MSYRKILLGILGLLILSLPLDHLKATVFGLPLYVPEILTLLGLTVFFFAWRTKAVIVKPLKSLDVWILGGTLLFFAGALFSLLANPLTSTGLGILKTWFVFPILMAWLVFQLEPEEPEKIFLLKTWLLSTTIVALGALGYLFLGTLTYDGRLSAWFGSPNYLAIFLAPGILVGFYFLRQALVVKSKKDTLLQLLSLCALLLVLFFTESYGVWLGIFGGVILANYFSTHDKRMFWKGIGLLLIVVGIFFFFERDNTKWQSLVSHDERSSMASRQMIWHSAGKMIKDNPVLGIGLGRFQEVYLEYQQYFPPYLEWAVPQPHNIILAVWLQTGILGLIGFTLLVSRTFLLLWQNKNRETSLFLGILTLYLVYGLFDTPYFKTDLAFAFWLLVSLSCHKKG